MPIAIGILIIGAAVIALAAALEGKAAGASTSTAGTAGATTNGTAGTGTAPAGAKTGKVSWFTGGNTASGVPTSVPGIAVCTSTAEPACQGSPFYGLDSLGGYWLVTLENGKQFVAKQTDIGPATWTNRIVDFTDSIMHRIGNPATDSSAALMYLGKSIPNQYQGIAIS